MFRDEFVAYRALLRYAIFSLLVETVVACRPVGILNSGVAAIADVSATPGHWIAR